MDRIVQLTEEQYLEAIKLSQYAFQYVVPEEKIAKRLEMLKSHHISAIFEEKQLAAKLHLITFNVFIGHKKWKMGGIAGVATYPEYRRKGYVKDLMQHSLEHMKREGCHVSMLHPFKISFYRKYGWELLTNRLKCTMAKSDLVKQDSVAGTINRTIENHPYKDLNEIYTQYASRYAGMLVRENAWWETIGSDLVASIYYDEKKLPLGYLLYSIKDSKMGVEEFVALNGEARRGLWNFICQHDSMVDTVEISLHEKDPLIYSLEEPNIKSELSPYFMVRIVDAEKFLQEYDFEEYGEEVTIQVTDTNAPWNEQTFSIRNGEATVLSEEEIKGKGNIIKMSINSLSTILFGYKRPSELYELQWIKGKKEEIQKLEQMIPTYSSFFCDFF
ncbi:GNAT family N-acetyltransferase [Sutcliffiella deserti]|uniref:GNAT family N-acetyltransferase n=1 Tax=Sutcliffiella deserti TaxID=2875501 RepID=UPI001CBFE95A|nr:GNAT family N-acetyltransferase [Sutcliffiella deserti]